MKYKNKIIKSTATSLCMLVLGFAVIDNASAYQGYYQSDIRLDFNGTSEVGTTYITGDGDAAAITLQNWYSNGKMFGGKTVGCAKDQMVSHKAWGFEDAEKFGVVSVKSIVHHVPWFDV